jgi:hypothetical protein
MRFLKEPAVSGVERLKRMRIVPGLELPSFRLLYQEAPKWPLGQIKNAGAGGGENLFELYVFCQEEAHNSGGAPY